MKLLISNIAWKNNENAKIVKLLNKKKIELLEFAPDILLSKDYSRKNLIFTKKSWSIKNIKLYSMQSVLYEVNNAFLYGNNQQRKNFVQEILKKIDIAKTLGTKVIIFGSPKNRKTFKKSKYVLDKIGLKIFKRIAAYANKKKIIFCLEANPKIYRADYLNNTSDVISIVKKINNKYLKINLDLSTIIYNRENIKKIIKENISLIGHAQISAPYLQNILKYKKKIKELVKILKLNNYKKNISIEMTRPKKNSHKQIEKSIDYVKKLITIN
ncbi:sugar phosphate isomerase/epimerase [Pelagibacterales bacterium SAG-MED20]|nr:sugar phosphate isomerase/epimerase [Pelagibacterales bacterium SAG-MED20]